MDITWGFVFRKGELECERPQSTYIPEPSVVPATQKPKRDRSCLSLGVLPWIPKEEGSTDSTRTTTDFMAGWKKEHLRQAEDPNCIHFGFWTPVLPNQHAIWTIVFLRTMNTSKTIGAILEFGCWGVLKKFIFPTSYWDFLLLGWFFSLNGQPLSPHLGKKSNTEEDWEEIWKNPEK